MSNYEKYVGTPWGIILCIDYCEDERIKGRIYHRYQNDPICFNDVAEAVLKIDKFFDELGYPFRGSKYHYFGGEEKSETKKDMTKKWRDDEMLKNNGNKGTFIIRVEQRQHSTWQGKITWMEEGKTETFRSALEMLKMIEGALNTENSENK